MIITDSKGNRYEVEGMITISFPEYTKVKGYCITAKPALIGDLLYQYSQEHVEFIGGKPPKPGYTLK